MHPSTTYYIAAGAFALVLILFVYARHRLLAEQRSADALLADTGVELRQRDVKLLAVRSPRQAAREAWPWTLNTSEDIGVRADRMLAAGREAKGLDDAARGVLIREAGWNGFDADQVGGPGKLAVAKTLLERSAA